MSENNVIEITIKTLIIQLIEIIVKLIIKVIIVINEITWFVSLNETSLIGVLVG